MNNAPFPNGNLADYCRSHGIRRLSLFGSQAKGNARPDSDIDLRTREELSRHFRRQVMRKAMVQYAA